jgi:hypothetical protein
MMQNQVGRFSHRIRGATQAALALSRRPIIAYSWGGGVFQAPLIACVLCLLLFTPSPGFAVAVLAFAAGVMAVRTDHFTRTERVVWILIAGALCFVELRAISKDRDEHDALQAEIREENDRDRRLAQRAFNDVLKQGSSLFAQEKQLSTQTLKNEKLAIESLAEATGGDSFPYVIMAVYQNSLLAQLSVCGAHPLHQVHITIVDEDATDVAFKTPGGAPWPA